MARLDPQEVVDAIFQRLDNLTTAVREVREATQFEELRRETFSFIAAETADGAAITTVKSAPLVGGLWEVAGVAVIADNAARRVVVSLGTDRPISAVTTDATDGIATPNLPAFVLPDGATIEASFPAAVAIGTRCRLHVWGTREIAGD